MAPLYACNMNVDNVIFARVPSFVKMAILFYFILFYFQSGKNINIGWVFKSPNFEKKYF
jgi:hypothetical protein